MNIKKIIFMIILIVIIVIFVSVAIIGNNRNKNNAKYKIVVSNFVSYDFLRAIIGDNEDVSLEFLIGPGKDSHSYEPTPQDLIKIQNSDLFVYIGGNIEKWHDKVLNSLDTNNTKLVCIADDIERKEKKEVDGAEEHEHHHEEDEHHHEGSYDEHIWTSPENAIIMVNTLKNAMENIDKKNANIYRENAENYINKIKEVENKSA